jgi:hypothetical protein
MSRVPSLPPPAQHAAWEIAARLLDAAEVERLRYALQEQ